MKKLINAPEQVVEQMLAGLLLAHPTLHQIGRQLAIANGNLKRKVWLVSGGGSGHEPLDVGYVGDGLLDAAILGPVFTPPSVESIVATMKVLGPKRPYLFIVKNFASDMRHFTLAREQLVAEGYQIGLVSVADDQSVDPDTLTARHRGVAGTVLMIKLLGAAADAGMALADLQTLATEVNHQLVTLGVALSSTEAPGQKKPAFDLGAAEIAYGIGIHGEPGYRSEPMVSSELLARELVNKLTQINDWPEKAPMAVMINGLGGLPLMDQFVFTHDAVELIRLHGFDMQFVKTGTLLTSYSMQGVSLTLLGLTEQWRHWLGKPVGGFAWGNG
ncbi:dihydroxyacetone kinase subunit DhaK [Lacticaseibacillus saniviri]|uniref:DhaKLM operon coactivator DhaQ n=1 Tax=Lacticaseibacillus saniviri JCM 17471 = DSM 24301 TaxID=1293598 RepID=A0A0R2MRZ4_9LACO|nr:dihydroxyacetone kinase subunit DhaK [Lacticaseibacillus saniviri]KRO15548.1 DhaKLM operon coactivator DhaQ [Lacticaseibacillus saniviri JCM 17471 = DSM 24301]